MVAGIEQVQIDATNQTMIIGDDVKRHRIEGNQLTIEDLSQEPYDDDTLVFINNDERAPVLNRAFPFYQL